MASPKRETNQSFEDFRVMRKHDNKMLKLYCKGRVFWNLGTYIKPKKEVI